ncbi:MAG TPA: DUF5615 family PIN-like protein [Stellaceae bacterium]|nr:DUF5615 family PIN-like protein [Stellaceae bacterium]
MPDGAPLRLLVDSCLTPGVIDHSGEVFGGRVDVVHVDRSMPPATPDREVLAWAMAERRLVVTANQADFLLLVQAGGHPGLGLVEDQNTRRRQIAAVERLVRAILDHVERGGTVEDHVFVLHRTGRVALRRTIARSPGSG